MLINSYILYREVAQHDAKVIRVAKAGQHIVTRCFTVYTVVARAVSYEILRSEAKDDDRNTLRVGIFMQIFVHSLLAASTSARLSTIDHQLSSVLICWFLFFTFRLFPSFSIPPSHGENYIFKIRFWIYPVRRPRREYFSYSSVPLRDSRLRFPDGSDFYYFTFVSTPLVE